MHHLPQAPLLGQLFTPHRHSAAQHTLYTLCPTACCYDVSALCCCMALRRTGSPAHCAPTIFLYNS
eukprot:1339626-Rhodomonas_salina.5